MLGWVAQVHLMGCHESEVTRNHFRFRCLLPEHFLVAACELDPDPPSYVPPTLERPSAVRRLTIPTCCDRTRASSDEVDMEEAMLGTS